MAERRFATVALSELFEAGLVPDTSPTPDYVLVVDDERIIADTLVEILSLKGYAATAAYDGASALEIARDVPPDVLLTDVVMPGMSGIELAIEMRRIAPSCQILLFSGQAATLDLLKQAHAQGYDFRILAKPLHPSELLLQLAEAQVDKSPAHVQRFPTYSRAAD